MGQISEFRTARGKAWLVVIMADITERHNSIEGLAETRPVKVDLVILAILTAFRGRRLVTLE
jgi:hypothetical protein